MQEEEQVWTENLIDWTNQQYDDNYHRPLLWEARWEQANQEDTETGDLRKTQTRAPQEKLPWQLTEEQATRVQQEIKKRDWKIQGDIDQEWERL
eukprot:106640-Prorocentrum_lima.AAC.1